LLFSGQHKVSKTVGLPWISIASDIVISGRFAMCIGRFLAGPSAQDTPFGIGVLFSDEYRRVVGDVRPLATMRGWASVYIFRATNMPQVASIALCFLAALGSLCALTISPVTAKPAKNAPVAPPAKQAPVRTDLTPRDKNDCFAVAQTLNEQVGCGTDN
jgi:hypothetical protein